MTPVTPFSAALRERSSNAHSGSEHAGFMSDLMKGEGNASLLEELTVLDLSCDAPKRRALSPGALVPSRSM